VIAVAPDFRVGPRRRIDVFFLVLVGRKPGQLERPFRVQDRVAFRAVAASDGTGATATASSRLTALAARRTGPAGRRGHGRRAAAGRRTGRGGVAAGGQVPGADVRLDGRERLLAGQAPGAGHSRLVAENRRRDAVYDVAQSAGVGSVRDGRYAGFGYQVLGAHRPVVHVAHVAAAAAATAAVRRPLQPAAPGRANRHAQALLLLLQIRDLSQREPPTVLSLHQ